MCFWLGIVRPQTGQTRIPKACLVLSYHFWKYSCLVIYASFCCRTLLVDRWGPACSSLQLFFVTSRPRLIGPLPSISMFSQRPAYIFFIVPFLVGLLDVHFCWQMRHFSSLSPVWPSSADSSSTDFQAWPCKIWRNLGVWPLWQLVGTRAGYACR